jgi:hypothetical protein
MPVEMLRWLIALVVVYAGVVVLRAAINERGREPSAEAIAAESV